MGEEQVRLQVPAEVAQVLVRPGRPDLAVEPRLRMGAVPAQPKTVAVDAGGRLERVDALGHKRMRRLGDVMLERGRFSAIGDPAAHKALPSRQATNVVSRIHRATLLSAISAPSCSFSVKIFTWASAEVPSATICRQCSTSPPQPSAAESAATRSSTRSSISPTAIAPERLAKVPLMP